VFTFLTVRFYARGPSGPTCREYVADYQSHGPHPVFDYLDQIYMQLNASRVAVGKAPVPLPGAKPWYTVRKWIAGMCTNNPGASVYDLTVTTYQMSVQAMSM